MKNIYLINQVDTNYYKIGITKKHPNLRIKELKVGNANELILVKQYKTKLGYQLESYLHSYFSSKRKELEWFELNQDDVDIFIDICIKGEKILSFLQTNNTLLIKT